MKKVLLAIALFFFSASCFAYNDYSTTKGDFKIFSLGDRFEVVKEKFNYLMDKKEISADSNCLKTLTNGFGWAVLSNVNTLYHNSNVMLSVSADDGLFDIKISFDSVSEEYYESLKNFVEQVVIKNFNSIYGKPVFKNSFPTINDLKKETTKGILGYYSSKYLVGWKTNSKIVITTVHMSTSDQKNGLENANPFHISIEIITPKAYQDRIDGWESKSHDFN